MYIKENIVNYTKTNIQYNINNGNIFVLLILFLLLSFNFNHINFNATNNMLQEGTNVYASNSNGTGTISYDIGNDLNIIASKDTYSYTSEEKTKSAGGSVGNNGVQFNYDQSDASSKVRSTTYNNVDIIGNNINIKTGNNTDIKGANVLAQAIIPNHSPLEGESNEQGLDRSSFGGGLNIGGNINMDIGNNLNIESLQDTYYAKSKSSSFGVSFGGGSSGASAGFNFGKTNSTTDSQWVNEQTSIIADNNVNIKTNNNTNLIGSVVASNSDNLSLNTGSLTYSDLNDFYREETKGYNFGTSVGADKTDQNKTNLHPQGSTTIGLTHTGQEKEQITRATIGLGNITINSKPLTPTPLPQGARDILAGLNRNVDNSQEITKDIITGALNGSMTIDNRVFTSDGRKEIVNQMVNLPGNIVKATAGAINTAVNPLITAYEVATNKDVGINDIVDQWKSNAKAGANMIKSDRNVINNLSTGKADVNDIQKATGNDKVKVYYDENDKVQGFHDNDTNDIYLNAANNTAINTDTFVRTYGHETAHDYTENESVANNAGSYAKGIFNTLNALSFDSVNTSGNATSKDWLGNQFSNVNSANALTNNTIKAGGVVDRSNRTYYAPGTAIGGRKEGDYEKDLNTANKFKEAFNDDGEAKVALWDGKNTIKDRKSAAEWILNDLKQNPLKEGEQLNLVGFSHGGNVVKETTNLDLNYKVDNIVFLATPHVDTHTLNYGAMSGNGNIYNFYGTNDYVQDVFGGINFDSLKINNPSQIINNSKVINVEVNQNPIRNGILDSLRYLSSPIISGTLKSVYSATDTHTNMHSDKTLEQFIIPKITNGK